ncbi:MAG TPA: glucan biosynthesis protein G [Candidatus Binatia bacterium]
MAVLTLASSAPGATFGFEDVAKRAQELAAAPYKDTRGPVPDWLLQISYDEWRDIRFRTDLALWRDRPGFQIQLFHLGLFYDRPVQINVVEGGQVKPVEFSPSMFDYGRNKFASQVPQDLGFAGFRIHYPIKTPKYHDEVAVFLGASYFRALGKKEVFGLSARGLAIDTAESTGEEFPYFREFWLVKPKPGAKEMVVYALLDSPSVAGAYRFTIKPGETTAMDVQVRLFLRREIKKLGLAPLTSMFFHGENTNKALRDIVDFRPEVHDSDGLLVHTGTGEWIWRPLENPRTLHVSSFLTEHPKGFGLIQRDRDFANYQDLEARSELRPSAFVAPKGDWGKGRVELVEIPTKSDVNDNIVAYWVPADPPQPGKPFDYSYTLDWYGDDAKRPPGGRVVATRHDFGTVENAHRFVIDFGGKTLEKIPADRVLRGVVTVAGGDESATILEQQVIKNEVTGGWRLTFMLRPQRRGPIDVRAFLDSGGDTLTETWSYVILP